MTGEQADKILSPDNSFWARVEMMGRRIYHGKVTTEAIGGAALLRVDVPPIPEMTVQERGYYRAENDDDAAAGKYGLFDLTYPASAGETHLVGIASIYEITPMTEAVATTLAAKARSLHPIRIVRIGEAKMLVSVETYDSGSLYDDYDESGDKKP